jgi:predicted nucleic acid-binding protein
MIVVDTNLIAYLCITGALTEHARRAYLRDPDWQVPILWRSEFRSVLSLYIRKKQISLEKASDIMREALAFVEGKEYQVSSSEVFNLISESRCSAYDCEFVALAKSLELKLVTSDKMVLKEFPKIAISLTEFAQPLR